MFTSEVIYLDNLRTEATHTRSGNKMITDAPVDNQGKGEYFSPTDTVATALATCMITTMAIQTRNDGLVLEGIRAQVEKHMTTTLPRRIARIVVRLHMPTGIPVSAREKLQKIAHACPVALSLHPEAVQDVSFVYPD